jgi:hypothetical protein
MSMYALRPLVSLLLALAVLVPSTGCGTLLFPERQDTSHSDRFDPNVLILDGLGLVFFVIPGLLAFGLDFYTGAIYLPADVEKGEGPFIRDAGASENGEE